MITALAIFGLMGSSAQGAFAAAAGFGAKIYGGLQAVALPALCAQVAYDLHGYLHPSNGTIHSNVNSDLGELHNKLNQLNAAVAYIPQVAKGLEAAKGIATSTTWYGKAWNGLCYFDALTDTVIGKFQKYMLLASVLGLGTLFHKTQAQPQPQESGEEQMINAIAEKVAAALPKVVPAVANPVMYMPRRGAARRSGVRRGHA